MFKRNVLASAIIATSMSSFTQAQIEEVVVTATKRSASTQDIAVAVTALGEESLDQMGISSFDDYLIQLPGVTAGGSGPGQSSVYIRGIASTTPNLTTSGVAGLAPNVAMYLDEQPLSQPGRNLDVYTADIARIEVLKGPQGTLFGASSQAGTVRLITNKPDPSGFSGKLKMGAAWTESGDPSNNVEGVVNIPLTDNFTARAVVYVDNKGGYIDNVAGTRSVAESPAFSGGAPGGVSFIEANNGNRTEDNFNDTTYSGMRISGLWMINDEWELLVGAAQQTIDTEGVFFVDPELDELEIQRFTPDSLEDSYDSFNWTLTGRLGELDMVYTGAFTDREANQFVDYTDYLYVGGSVPYYVCDRTVAYETGTYTGAANPTGNCQSPEMFTKNKVTSEFISHEIRFSTDQSSALRATFGAFYSDLELRELTDFTYPGGEQTLSDGGWNGAAPVAVGYGPSVSNQDSSASRKGVWPEGVMFVNDVLRTDEQYAVFGELSYDLTEQLSLTVGARWYDVEVDLKGSATGAFNTASRGQIGISEPSDGRNLDLLFSKSGAAGIDTAATDGVIGKVSLAWTPIEDVLLYATWSEGFRPGLLNRPGGATDGAGYTVPYAIDTDEVTNYEFGWKADMLDQTVRFNGTVFFVDIERLQASVFNPDITNLFFAENAANAEVMGMEGDLTWMPSSVAGLSLNGSFSLLDTEITKVLVPTDVVKKGDSLAFAPELQFTFQARYEWDLLSGALAHVMGHMSYSDEAYTDIITTKRYALDSWTMLGLTAGVSEDAWTAELFIDNVTDERAEISGNANYNKQRNTVTRPRTMGLRFSYNF
ncbi:MAG: outer membrane receptor protein involved in Fe transport [Oceanicoccus sp.]|jgi:outer membrane receptor protein involved in Fe transport